MEKSMRRIMDGIAFNTYIMVSIFFIVIGIIFELLFNRRRSN